MLEVHWQRPLWTLPRFAAKSGGFHATLKPAKLSVSHLRPDFVMQRVAPEATLLVEVKHTRMDGAADDRQAIAELLADLRDASDVMREAPSPRALAVAWNSKAIPAVGAEVIVSNQDSIGVAINAVLAQWAA